MYRFGFILVAVLAVLLGLAVGTLNAERVTLDLLWVQLYWPLGLLILLALATGLLLGHGLSWFFQVLPLRLRQRREVRGSGVAAPPSEPHDG